MLDVNPGEWNEGMDFFDGALGILGKTQSAPRLGSTFRRTQLLTGCAGAGPHNSIKHAQQRTISKNPQNPAQYWVNCLEFLQLHVLLFINKIETLTMDSYVASLTYVCFILAKGLIRDLSASSSNIAFEVPLASKWWWQSVSRKVSDESLGRDETYVCKASHIIIHCGILTPFSNWNLFKRFSGHFLSENTLSTVIQKYIYKVFFVVLRGPVL